MTNELDELDEFGRRTLEALRDTPPLNSSTANELKARYLSQADSLRQAGTEYSSSKPSAYHTENTRRWSWHPRPILKTLAAVFLAISILLIGSSLTVFAAQDSLPGQALYPVKSWSEDVSLSFAPSPQAKLSLILQYTNRRMNEISILSANGRPVTRQTSERFEHQLDEALQYAIQLNDQQMLSALQDIKQNAQKQGITLQDVINKLPVQAGPAAVQLQQRLNEQVQLSNLGEADPQNFRNQIRERARNRQHIKQSSGTELPEIVPGNPSSTPQPDELSTDQPVVETPGKNQSGQNDQGNGQGQPSPGGGNHGQEPSRTPKP